MKAEVEVADKPGYVSRRMSANVGMEICGLDLTEDLSDETVASLRQDLVSSGVIFFRNQRLDVDTQVAVARRFGHVPLVPNSAFGVHPDNPHVSVLENDHARPPTVNNWHSDNSFKASPDFGSLLRAVKVPEAGGDTLWTSMYAAYDALDDRMKALLEGLTAVHDYMKLYERPIKRHLWEGERGDLMRKMRDANPPVVHPVVIVHPETGRKALFVNPSFTRHITELSENDSRHILNMLFEHALAPEFQVRFSWKAGDVAMWDNRCTMHYAVADFYPAHRIMNRVTILEKAPETVN